MNQTWKETMLITSNAKRAWLTWAAGAIALTAALPAQAQLETALSAARQSSAASAAAQRQIEEADDAAGSAVREYRAVLQQLDNTKLFVKQQQIFLDSQASEINSVRNQLGTVEQIKQGISPMMLRMTVALEDAIKADVPFRVLNVWRGFRAYRARWLIQAFLRRSNIVRFSTLTRLKRPTVTRRKAMRVSTRKSRAMLLISSALAGPHSSLSISVMALPSATTWERVAGCRSTISILARSVKQSALPVNRLHQKSSTHQSRLPTS